MCESNITLTNKKTKMIFKEEIDKITDKITYNNVVNKYYEIIKNKPLSDHNIVISDETKIISWNVYNDYGYMTAYKYDDEFNNLDKFPKKYQDKINELFSVGQDFRASMENEPIYDIFLENRFNRINTTLQNLILDDKKYRICLQECSYKLCKYLEANSGFKYVKYIQQDVVNVCIGKITDFCINLNYLLNWHIIKNNYIIKSQDKFAIDNLIINFSEWNNHTNNTNDINKEWQQFILTQPTFWEQFLTLCDELYYNNISDSIKSKDGSYFAILSNTPFILLPCFCRSLYTDCVIGNNDINNSFGIFVTKSRGCIGIGIDENTNLRECLRYESENTQDIPILNLHLTKSRIETDYLKILNNALFSYDYETTVQIEKYFYGNEHNLGVDNVLSKIYDTKDIKTFKNIFIKSAKHILHKKFVKNIFELNNITNLTNSNNKLTEYIKLSSDIDFDYDIDTKSNTFDEYYLDTQTLNDMNGYIMRNKYIFAVGDFNCCENDLYKLNIYYNLKKLFNMPNNLPDNLLNNSNYYWNITKFYANSLLPTLSINDFNNELRFESKIDHILLMEITDNSDNNLLISHKYKYYNEIYELYNNTKNNNFDYDIIKKNNVILWNVECSKRKKYYNAKNDIDIIINDKKQEHINYIISNVLSELLFEHRIYNIINTLEEQVSYDDGEITTKIYLQNVSFHLTYFLDKSKLKFKNMKFVSNILTNSYINNLSRISQLELKQSYINIKSHNVMQKNYDEYNNFGYCVLSNEPIFIIPYMPEICLYETNNNIKMYIRCNGCIDLLTNTICTTNNSVECKLSFSTKLLTKLKCDSFINKIKYVNVENKGNLLFIIDSLKKFLLDRYYTILCDNNRDFLSYLHKNTQKMSFSENTIHRTNYITTLSNTFINLYNNEQNKEILILGNYSVGEEYFNKFYGFKNITMNNKYLKHFILD